MKILKQATVILIATMVLSGCNKIDINPLTQMPAKKAAKVLLDATKVSNSKAGLPQSGDTYLMCLNQKLDANNCQKLYDSMAENLNAKGVGLSATVLASFQPSDELKKELQYQVLVDDEG